MSCSQPCKYTDIQEEFSVNTCPADDVIGQQKMASWTKILQLHHSASQLQWRTFASCRSKKSESWVESPQVWCCGTVQENSKHLGLECVFTSGEDLSRLSCLQVKTRWSGRSTDWMQSWSHWANWGARHFPVKTSWRCPTERKPRGGFGARCWGYILSGLRNPRARAVDIGERCLVCPKQLKMYWWIGHFWGFFFIGEITRQNKCDIEHEHRQRERRGE